MPESVNPGSLIFLNDGFIQLPVEKVSGDQVFCRTIIGGPLLSYKGLHLPGVKIFADAVSDTDLEFVAFALKEGVDAFGVSSPDSSRTAGLFKIRLNIRRMGVLTARIRCLAQRLSTIVFLRHMFLAYQHRIETDDRTFGGLFYACCEEVADISFAVPGRSTCGSPKAGVFMETLLLPFYVSSGRLSDIEPFFHIPSLFQDDACAIHSLILSRSFSAMDVMCSLT